MKYAIFDCETNGLLDELDRIHVLVVRVFNGEHTAAQVFRRNQVGDTIAEGLELLMRLAAEGYLLIGHNVIRFDYPAFRKVYPWFALPQRSLIDTIVLTRLMYPDLKAQDAWFLKKGLLPKHLYKKHSLEAWGRRLGNHKGDYDGDPLIADEQQRKAEKWSRWNQAMEDYCVQDTSTTESLYEFLMAKNPSPESVRLEHDVAWIVLRQINRGVKFDSECAARLYADLSQARESLTRQLREVFPPFLVRDGKVFTPKRDNKKQGYCEGAPLQKLKRVEFNPSSRDHVALMLTRRYGWEPEEFTDDGKPKIDDAVLKKLTYPEAPILADYYVVTKRIGQVAEGDEAWLKRVKPNGRIYGDVTTNGAVTGRMTHSKPNLAQVPKVKPGKDGKPLLGLKGEYGFESRSCFTTDGWLVGADGAALELRDLAGYMAKWDGGAYVRTVLEGKKEDGTEIHTVNRKALEIDSRDDAKTWFYAFLYGAGDEKLGTIVTKVRGDAARKKGKELREKFMRNLPALGALVKAVKAAAKERGFLFGLDGRKLHVRSQHSALNTLLQSAGAIQMKKALVILDETLQQKGLKPGVDYEFVLNVHDEWQIEVPTKEIADEVGRTAVAAIRAAGEYFKFPCPLDGEYKIGRTWAETH